MSPAIRELADRALDAGLLLTMGSGVQVEVESPLGPPPDALIAELKAHRLEFLAYVGWKQRAEQQIIDWVRSEPEGATQAADRALTEAFWSQDLRTLRKAIEQASGAMAA